jgi:hypothetical protein
MVEIKDDMTAAAAILLLAEYAENIGEPERSFVISVMEGAAQEMQAAETDPAVATNMAKQ